ncbi:hypothetical protein TIFTF001_007642 [Ficus carica]|uniref:Uncharacterized protein n=1 Tax=Ficus carica TaxID=3494 RepID=A0AA88CZU6_FICCA|nr:hypothetical protein TIFTF001_007642 [Ficus carica]
MAEISMGDPPPKELPTENTARQKVQSWRRRDRRKERTDLLRRFYGGPVGLTWKRSAIAFTALEIGGVEGDRSDDDQSDNDRREDGRQRSEVRRE